VAEEIETESSNIVNYVNVDVGVPSVTSVVHNSDEDSA